MKTKIIALTITVMLMSLPFADTLYSGMNGNADKLSNDQSNVFSPGYINAAKYKTEAVINQLNPKKSFMERAVAYIQNKVSNKAEEESTDKVQPELKHKTSGTSDANNSASSASATTSVKLPAGKNNDAEIPAYIRDTVQEYMTNNSSNASFSYYKLKYYNGKYYGTWTEEDSHHNYRIMYQVFNSTGRALYNTPMSLTGDRLTKGAFIDNISTLANGNIAVFWEERDLNRKYSLRYQVLDTAAYTTPITLTGDRPLKNITTNLNVTTLANGNIAVFWEETDLNYNQSLKYQVFNSTGSALYNTPMSLTGDRLLNNIPINLNVSTLANGGIAVFWNERDLNSKYSLKSQVFDSTGNALYTTPTSLTGDRLLNGASINNISTFANGNIAVFWKEWDLNYNQSPKYQVFNSTGSALYNAPVTLTGDRLTKGVSINNIHTLANGSIAVFWEERDLNRNYSLKFQIFDSTGSALYGAPVTLTGDRLTTGASIRNIHTLANGNIAVFWGEADLKYNDSLKYQVFNSTGNALYAAPISLTGDRLLLDVRLDDIYTFANGNIAVFWKEWAKYPDYNYYLKLQMFDSTGNALYTTPMSLAKNGLLGFARMQNISTLGNGNIAVFWDERDSNGNHSLNLHVFDSTGNTLYAVPMSLTGDRLPQYIDINNVSTLANGNIAIFWNESSYSGSSFRSQVLSSSGSFVSRDFLRPVTQNSVFSYLDRSILLNPYMVSLKLDTLRNSAYEAFEVNSIIGNKNLSNVFKSLLANKNVLPKDEADDAASAKSLIKSAQDSLEYAVAIPTMNNRVEDIRIAAVLADILKNPTEDQKLILDTIQAILAETDKAVDQSSSPEYIKKASDDILQAVTAVLIAQAVPDLLKEGDMSNIKGIFSELKEAKGRIMTFYNESTKPYYDETIKELAKNMAILQLNNIIANSMTKEELMKLPRDEIDKVLEKIRQRQNKSFEEEYILQQESKYRKKYVEPNNKMLEEAMKAMIKDFARRISVALEGVKARSK